MTARIKAAVKTQTGVVEAVGVVDWTGRSKHETFSFFKRTERLPNDREDGILIMLLERLW